MCERVKLPKSKAVAAIPSHLCCVSLCQSGKATCHCCTWNSIQESIKINVHICPYCPSRNLLDNITSFCLSWQLLRRQLMYCWCWGKRKLFDALATYWNCKVCQVPFVLGISLYLQMKSNQVSLRVACKACFSPSRASHSRSYAVVAFDSTGGKNIKNRET